MEIADLVGKAKSGDTKAFTALVESHQNLALGYAFSKLGDFHRAQDVVQDSFLIAYQSLNQLEDPKKFSGWFRSIVHHRCHRVFRMNLKRTVSFEDELEVCSGDELPSRYLQNIQERKFLHQAILELPEKHREVVSLFYLEEESQKSVAEFLGIPVTKVNNYLSEARQTLKGRLLNMAEDTFRNQRLSEEFAKNIGEIIGVNGSIVETKVNKSARTTVFDVLGSKTKSNNLGSDMIVFQRMKNGNLRCISTGKSIAEKSKLYNSGNYEKAIKELKEDKIVEAVESMASSREKPVIETGIKVIDLLCPLRAGGSVGIFGREGVGRFVQVQEIIHRREKIGEPLILFFFVDRWHALGTQDVLETDPDLASDVNGNIQTAWIIHDKAGDPAYAKSARYLDACLYFSPLKAIEGIWPALDPLNCYSSAMDPALLSKDHYETAREVLELLKTAHDELLDPVHLEFAALGAREDAVKQRNEFVKQKIKSLDTETRTRVKRGLLLERFFTQPFFVTEDFSGTKGIYVPLKDTISSCNKILSGEFDKRDFKDVSYLGLI